MKSALAAVLPGFAATRVVLFSIAVIAVMRLPIDPVEAQGFHLPPQPQAWMEAWAYTWNNIFFNNAHDGTGDNNAPVGLKTRIVNYQQYGVASDMAVNANANLATVTASSANDLIDGVNKLLINMNAADGTNVVLYMNETM